MRCTCTGCAPCVQVTRPSVELQLSYPCYRCGYVATHQGEESVHGIFSHQHVSWEMLVDVAGTIPSIQQRSVAETAPDQTAYLCFDLEVGQAKQWSEPWLLFPPSGPQDAGDLELDAMMCPLLVNKEGKHNSDSDNIGELLFLQLSKEQVKT